MSKKSKLATREANKKEKAAKKARMQAQYDAWRAAGTNQKSKRNVLRGKRTKRSADKHKHLVPMCGNTGCANCFPRPPQRLFGAGHDRWVANMASRNGPKSIFPPALPRRSPADFRPMMP